MRENPFGGKAVTDEEVQARANRDDAAEPVTGITARSGTGSGRNRHQRIGS